jgi:hypothetical protein
VTIEEVRARLRTGRPFSALLVDGSVSGVDRDLFDEARSCACAVVIIDDGRTRRDWTGLGATAVLTSAFGRDELLDALDAHAVRIGIGSSDVARRADDDGLAPLGWRGQLVAVTGAGGTGASVVAMSLAQGFAADVRLGGLVALADLALDADQAMLHDAGDVVPGVQELVEIHRNGQPAAAEIRSLTYTVPDRGYDLLLGLRRHRDWATIRPRTFEAALDGLRRSYKTVVADVSHDVEGERQCGSMDVEERNLMARSTTSSADVVVVVGAAGPRGIHRMVRIVAALVEHGVEGGQILPVVNRAPRSPRTRAEITAALSALTQSLTIMSSPLPTPVFVGDRRRFDEVLHSGARLPDGVVGPVCSAVRVMLDRVEMGAGSIGPEPEPVAVVPGSLGSWYAEDS